MDEDFIYEINKKDEGTDGTGVVGRTGAVVILVCVFWIRTNSSGTMV